MILNAAYIRQTMCKPLNRPGRLLSWYYGGTPTNDAEETRKHERDSFPYAFPDDPSVEPVLDSQAWHSFEIGSVGGQEKCVVDQRRRRDFQIPRADAKLLPAEIIKLPGRSLIERNDFELLSVSSRIIRPGLPAAPPPVRPHGSAGIPRRLCA
jgi:hypothetical protein